MVTNAENDKSYQNSSAYLNCRQIIRISLSVLIILIQLANPILIAAQAQNTIAQMHRHSEEYATPIPPTAEEIDALFYQILLSYLNIPQPIDTAEQTKYEEAFAQAVETYTQLREGLNNNPIWEPTGTQADSHQAVDTNRSSTISTLNEDGTQLDLLAQDEESGRAVSWSITDDPEALIVFDQAMTQVMTNTQSSAIMTATRVSSSTNIFFPFISNESSSITNEGSSISTGVSLIKAAPLRPCKVININIERIHIHNKGDDGSEHSEWRLDIFITDSDDNSSKFEYDDDYVRSNQDKPDGRTIKFEPQLHEKKLINDDSVIEFRTAGYEDDPPYEPNDPLPKRIWQHTRDDNWGLNPTDPLIPNSLSMFIDDQGSDNYDYEIFYTVACVPADPADLQISLSTNKSDLMWNDTLDYTLTVQNLGPTEARNVTLTTDIMPGNQFSEIRISGCPQVIGSNPFICHWADIPPGDQKVVVISTDVISTAPVGAVSNSARIEVDPLENRDPLTNNNIASSLINIRPNLDLEISTTAPSVLFKTPDSVTYTTKITVSHQGSLPEVSPMYPAQNVVINSPLNSNVEYIGASFVPKDSGSCQVDTANNLTCALSSPLDPDSTVVINLDLKVPDSIPVGTTFQNEFSVLHADFDTDTANNQSSSPLMTLTDWDLDIGAPGLDGEVLALAVIDDLLLAGGAFSNAIAEWNSTTWSALGGGLDGRVNTIVLGGTDIYVGGVFPNAPSNVAKWDGSSWTYLGDLRDAVKTVAINDKDEIYAGGNFPGRVARWDGADWALLGSGIQRDVVDGTVNAIAFIGDDLYAGGDFQNSNNIASWDGTSWHPLNDSGPLGNSGLSGPVYDLAVMGTDLYVGGEFLAPDGKSAPGLAKWNGRWHAVGGGSTADTRIVRALAVDGSNLYVGGSFNQVGENIPAANLALWNGVQWTPLRSGANAQINAILPTTGLYIGGGFDQVDCLPIDEQLSCAVNANHVAHWAPASIDLALTQTVSTNQAATGQSITYQFDIQNLSDRTATNVQLVNELPIGFNFVSGNACTAIDNVVTCDIGTLTGNLTQTLQITATAALTPGTYVNTTYLHSTEVDLSGENNVAATSIAVIDGTDIVLEIAGPTSVNPNVSTIDYSVFVRNDGLLPAQDVTLINLLPDKTNPESVSSSNCSLDGNEIICSFGELPPSAQAVIEITASLSSTISTGDTLTNEAEVNSSTLDVKPGNNVASHITTVADGNADGADLSLKYETPSHIIAGGSVTYGWQIQNLGPNPTSAIVLTDTVPLEVNFIAGNSSNNCQETNNNQVVCQLGNLNVGELKTVLISGQIPITTPAGIPIENTASVTGQASDPDLSNNQLSITSLIEEQADLQLSQTATPQVNVGEQITYDLTVVNQGPSIARDVLVSSQLPLGTNFIEATSDQAACSHNTESHSVACALSTLAPGDSIAITVIVEPLNGGTITNLVEVVATTSDPDFNNNSSTSTSNVLTSDRQTRDFGNLRIKANRFAVDPDNNAAILAIGDIELGASTGSGFPFMLSGSSNTLSIINNVATTLTDLDTVYRNQDSFALFSGAFEIDGNLPDPVIAPLGDIQSEMAHLANFELDTSPVSFTNIRLLNGEVSGNANLHLTPPGLDQSVNVKFTLKPDLDVIGEVSPFSLNIAGTTLEVSNAQLSWANISANGVKLQFKGNEVTIPSIEITPNSFNISGLGGIFPLPDIVFGDALKLTQLQANLAFVAGKHVIRANGTLIINLPDNQSNIQINNLRIDGEGNFSGSVSQLDFVLAGSDLKLRDAVFNNAGLTVAYATLKLPQHLGQETITLSNVSITGSGIEFGGASLSFIIPDIEVGGGSVFKLNDTRAELQVRDNHYEFGINGKLHVTLPQNVIDVAFEASLNNQGNLVQFKLTNNQKITLKLAILDLELSNVELSEEALITKAKIILPEVLGGSGFDVGKVRIDRNGIARADQQLRSNARKGGFSIPVPDDVVKLGSAAGFRFKDTKLSIAAEGGAYKATINGSLSIFIPGTPSGAEQRVAGSISVDSQGRVRGTVEGFRLGVAGLTLEVKEPKIHDGKLSVQKAGFKLPASWGGLTAEVYQVEISPDDLSIGGGRFALPEIKVGSIRLMQLEAKLEPIFNNGKKVGYEIGAAGGFYIPGLGGSSCSIDVGVTLFAGNGHRAMADIVPLETSANAASNKNEFDRISRVTPEDRTAAIESLRLKKLNAKMVGCFIPIANTGLGISRVEGGLELLDTGATRITLGVTIETAFKLIGVSPIAGDVDMGLQFDPFQLDLAGAVRVFSIIQAAKMQSTIRDDFFSAKLHVVSGTLPFTTFEGSLTAWTDDGFHMVGQAKLTVGFKKGSLGEVWFIPIPPFSLEIASVGADFGEFRHGNGSAWGAKFWVDLPIIDQVGVYINDRGKFALGNVNKYKTITPPELVRALRLIQEIQEGTRERQALSVEDQKLLNSTHFTDDAVLIDVDIPIKEDIAFGLGRRGAEPSITILRPDQTEVTSDNVDNFADISYEVFTVTDVLTPSQEVVTNTVMIYRVAQAEVGTWQVKLAGEIGTAALYQVDVIGYDAAPTLSNLGITTIGDNVAEANWSLTSNEITTTLDIYAVPNPITRTFVLTDPNDAQSFITRTDTISTEILLAQNVSSSLDGTPQSQTLDLNQLESGTYWFRFNADDGRNPGVKAYAPASITVSHPWLDTWQTTLTPRPSYRQIDLQWEPHANPDVDTYQIYYATDLAELPSATNLEHTWIISGLETVDSATNIPLNQLKDVIEVEAGRTVSTTVSTLTPQQIYYFSVGAVDVDSGQISFSEAISATAASAPFDLKSDIAELTLAGGSEQVINLLVSTELEFYPSTVSLIDTNPADGISVIVDSTPLTPTIAGVPIQATVSATEFIADGTYYTTIEGHGGGETRQINLAITVEQPTFDLNVTPQPIIIEEHENTTIVDINAIRHHGEDDPIHLTLQDVPEGLQYAWPTRIIQPESSVGLTLIDTPLLDNGTYTMTLSGEDGEQVKTISVPVIVNKPNFTLTTDRLRRSGIPGERVMFPLDVTLSGWPHPLLITMDEKSPVPGSLVSIFEDVNGIALEAVTVDTSQRLYLVVDITPETELGTYFINIEAGSFDRLETLQLELAVYPDATQADVGVSIPEFINAAAGTSYSYPIIVNSYGPLPATSVTLTGTLPITETQLISLTPDQGSCASANGSFTCNLGNMDRDAQINIQVEQMVRPTTPDRSQFNRVVEVDTTAEEMALFNNQVSGRTRFIGKHVTFMPLLMKDYPLPDLVGSFSLNPNKQNFIDGEPVQITATITNTGLAPSAAFWVDFFINPSMPLDTPTAWNELCGMDPCLGIAWLVSDGLAPGESITLTSTLDSYSEGHTIWPGWFAEGTRDLYLYVDSWNENGGDAVREIDESNNRFEIRGLSVTSTYANNTEIELPKNVAPRYFQTLP